MSVVRTDPFGSGSRITRRASPWTGRDDGDGPEHRRWHQLVSTDPRSAGAGPGSETCVLIGFASDEGVRRNSGRPGAAAGPAALRTALAPTAVSEPLRLLDLGDVEVTDGRLERAQETVGELVGAAVEARHLPVVLGGGHEIAFGTHLGLSSTYAAGQRVGILNLDAHFDLRPDPVASSGTPFRQILDRGHGTNPSYTVVGISESANTRMLFDTAHERGVRYLLDDDCGLLDREAVRRFVRQAVDRVDSVHLTIDLDVLPAGTAPGVSAPAALGVPIEVVQAACDVVADSRKLVAVDVAELNPRLDQDDRTARVAARLLHRIVTRAARARPARSPRS